MSSTTASEKNKNMAELDKFKRRMIRTVARLMKEKKSQSDVWNELKKESGCDCKVLWQRMRILTLKKLKRLLLADDRSESIPEIARMTLTDWLLFDLVLVHEKVDVIGREGLSTDDSKAMRNIFELVQKFEIMDRQGDSLAEAWANATLYYNSMGHQCSPMLLQRRWYQLMEYTRDLFYKFWFNYRGNAKLLVNAQPYTPSQLQTDIAKRFPELITKPFLDWERRIQNKTVIMPEEFEAKLRNRAMLKPPIDDNVPDIVVVEPVIETIDLGQDSDDEQTQTLNAVTVKDEPKDTDGNDGSDMSDIEILESTHIPQDTPTTEENIENEDLQDELQRLQMEEDNVINASTITDRDCETDAPNETSEETIALESVESNPSPAIIMPQITNVFGNVNISNETLTKISNLAQKGTIFDKTAPKVICVTENMTAKVETGIPNIINRVNNNDSEPIVIDDEENICNFPQSDKSPENKLAEDNVVDTDNIEKRVPVKANNSSEPKIILDADVTIQRVSTKNHNNIANDLNKDQTTETHIKKIPDSDFFIANNNIYNIHVETSEEENVEIANPGNSTPQSAVQDKDIDIVPQITTKIEIFGIENDNANNSSEDDEVTDIININFDKNLETHTEAAPESGKDNNDCMKFFDHSHHMDINFADDGIELVDDGIEYVEDETEVESKLVTSQMKDESADGEDETSDNPKFDLKLIMDPVVYTVKLDDMHIFKNKPFHNVKDKVLINNISIESKPVSKKSVKNINIENLNHSNISDDKIINDNLFEHSLCDESVKEEIEDIQKVKLSSGLLQKPKSRSYNPIQLCKNPDFNTRLKRLPIGFYSSSRNLLLLKACKPMTIDVSKAFESKLLNGVMYLKASDSIIQSQHDSNENNLPSSILPSAMPVQSLIDIKKVSDLIEMSKKHSETTLENISDDGTISERSKVIDLPDISKIRNINQHLLTAEVTPIKIKDNDNNICKVQVETKTDELYIINDTTVVSDICHDSSNIILKGTSNTTVHVDETLKNIESKNNSIPLITQERTTALPTFECDSNRKTEANQFKIKNTDTNLNNNTKSEINKKYTIQNHIGPWRPRLTLRSVSWLSGPKYVETITQENTLITTDTLDKMLNLLDGKQDITPSKPTKKKKKNNTTSNVSNKKNAKSILGPSKSSAKTGKESNNQNPKRIKKLKINILSSKTGPEYRGVHCCWAREKIFCRQHKSKRLSRHYCRPLSCICCCKDKLDQISQLPSVNTDEHNNLMIQKACESIESVVQQTREMSVTKNFVTKVLQVVSVDDSDQSVDTVPQTSMMKNFINTISSMNVLQDTSVDSDPKETTNITSIDSTAEVPTANIHSEILSGATTEVNSVVDSTVIDTNTLNAQPILVSALNCDTTTSMTTSTNTLSTGVTVLDSTCESPSCKSLLKTTYIPVVREAPTQSTVKYMTVNTKNNSSFVVCTCTSPKVSLDSPQRRIVIDGSKTCLVHSPKKHAPNKILFLNSNQISRNPTESPVYIGKNKILLTNIKLPRKEDIPQSSLQIQPKVIPTIPLPNGVQIIMTLSGDLSYTVVPGVELTAEQLSNLPGILAAVQEQINSKTVPLQSNSLPNNNITSDEIINLSDDDNTENSVNLRDQNQEANPNVIQGIHGLPLEQPQLAMEKASLKEISCNHHVETSDTISNISISAVMEDNVTTTVTQEYENGNIKNSDMYAKDREYNNSDAEKINIAISESRTPPRQLINTQEIETIEKLHKTEQFTYENLESTILENVTLCQDNSNKNKNLDGNSEFLKSINLSKHEEFNSLNNISENTKEPEKNDSDISANRKTLLSDLMEMSGISAEDTTPMPLEHISQELDINQVPNLQPISRNETSESQSYVELSSITSFTELKYASERNGLFFKLDIETGVIVPINVCIKKKNKPVVDKTVAIAPKIVVDLTDYHGVSASKSETVTNNTNLCLVSNKLPRILVKRKQLFYNQNHIKPIKLFKAVHASATKRSSQLTLQNNANKQLNKNKIETTINLDSESDNPMEEEYLVNISDPDNGLQQSNNSHDDDDSSDDEPLAKKAKRIRAIDDINNETVPNEIVQRQVENLQESNLRINKNNVELMDVHTASGMEPVLSPTLSFISNHSNSDAEEDCILGV